EVVICDNTRRLLDQSFRLADLGAQHLKGFSEPVRAWRVVAELASEGRFEASHHTGESPLIDREREIKLLRQRWSQVKRGKGATVVISGEAGIGKSRIVHALREQIAGDPHVLLRYNCSPYHTNSDLYPVIGQLERAAGFEPDMSAERKLAALERLLAETGEAA